MGVDHQKDQAMIRNGIFSPAPTSTSLERGEGLEMELMIDQAYMRKPP